MKILIVDDSAAMRMIVKKTLRLAGFEGHDISDADDGAKALAAIKTAKPDLVLSDWNMPNMTGLQLLEALGSDNVKVTFGFITTEATADMRTKALAAGAKFLISKPFTPESFKESLSAYIR
ncbi:MAG: two-component system, chemotaxis family, chemotaxis protein CheY [Gammaproteobacteria bacterium]|jgi:two-component system chemotaxis response regulator CheY|nr:two-component system, chemotaxis family, chemotaxis protein CheY [Gammaproteobacteria bacterium]